MQQLVERGGVNTHNRLITADQPLFGHVDRHAQRCLGCPLTAACLQHIEPVLLDGELDILHIAIMLFQQVAGFDQPGINRGHLLLEREIRIAAGLTFTAGQIARRADTGDDILTLRIDEKLAVKDILTCRRVARERHTSGTIITHIAENHRLNIHRRPP